MAFYPTRWIQRVGFQHGLEVVMASAARRWALDCKLTATRAVPEDSLIFELCRTGQTRAVKTLLNKRLASVVDTSPKGWKPLHVSNVQVEPESIAAKYPHLLEIQFAAANGHVDLCAILVEAGADKTALVYEGPNASILQVVFYDT
jgi:hypothetical protein